MAPKVLDDRYEIQRTIGGGGMGTIFKALDRETGDRVAIKMLHPHLTDRKDVVIRFVREAMAAKEAYRSEHIIKVRRVGRPQNAPPYIVMEYLDGEDAADILQNEGAIDPARACRIIMQVCDALAEAHGQGVIHRDLKPENVFVSIREDGSEWVKLLDFGIAKFKESPDGQPRTLTAAGARTGTPRYMAPEQVDPDIEVDHRADVYALGVILYELLAGRAPFDAVQVGDLLHSIMTEEPTPPRQHRPELSEALEQVVLKAMAFDPRHRYQGVDELGRALAPHAGAARESAISRASDDVSAEAKLLTHPLRKRSTWLIGIAVVAVSVFIGAGLSHLLAVTVCAR